MSKNKGLVGMAVVCWAVLLWSGCAPTHHAAVEADLGQPSSSGALLEVASQPGPLRVRRVLAADWTVERGGLINLDHPRAVEAGLEDGPEPIQIYFYVLEHPTRGTFLVDTGVAASFRDPETAPVSWLIASAMNMEALQVRQDTASWLKAQGQAPQGIFLTHLHMDHVMGLPDLPAQVPIYVGAHEHEDSRAMYMATRGSLDEWLEAFGPLRQWAFSPDPDGALEAVVDVFGDASLFAIHVPGHTEGSTAFVARTPEGPVLIAGDASHTAWGWDHLVEPGSFNGDGPRSARSLRQLHDLADRLPEVHVFPGHQSLARD